LRVPGAFDGFELAARAVVGQQISVRAARTLLGRLVRELGVPLGIGENALLFPTASRVADASADELARIGLTPARAGTLRGLAAAVARGGIDLQPGASVETAVAQLVELRGVGAWTAQYVAMRALRWPDAFPANDLVVLRALNETRPARAIARSEAWRPWRAYAVMHLWKGSS
jgi:AraC family transcriptional regulator of adaptative response / DNA-3-methyladenine glycosylase II